MTRSLSAVFRGLIINSALAVFKILAGLLGNSYALIADGIESSADVFSSLVILRGLNVSRRAADDDYHFGYAKAEALAAAVVSVMLLGAAIGVGIVGIREILTPHHLPAPFTLVVLVLVVGIKETLFRKVLAVGLEVESSAVKVDAWHHRSDALTSVAAFIGIAVALLGGPGWESADDYAAIFAGFVIAYNGLRLLREACGELMDRAPEGQILSEIQTAASSVAGVCLVEKLMARKFGMGYLVDMHVHADPQMSLREAHILSGKVKSAVKAKLPQVINVLIHMEPEDHAGCGPKSAL